MVVLIEGFQATSYLVGSRLTFLKTRKLNTSPGPGQLEDGCRMRNFTSNDTTTERSIIVASPGPAEISISRYFNR